MGFIVLVHRFMQQGKISSILTLLGSEFWSKSMLVRNFASAWACWWLEEAKCFGWENFWGLIFQSSNLLLLCNFNLFIPTLYAQVFLFLVRATTIPIYGRCYLFWGLGASHNFILFFSLCFRVFSPDDLSSYQGTLSHLRDFFKHVVWWW